MTTFIFALSPIFCPAIVSYGTSGFAEAKLYREHTKKATPKRKRLLTISFDGFYVRLPFDFAQDDSLKTNYFFNSAMSFSLFPTYP